jgi:hypothetical protein
VLFNALRFSTIQRFQELSTGLPHAFREAWFGGSYEKQIPEVG